MTIAAIAEQLGNALMMTFLVGIPAYGYFRKVPVYETFIEGAKQGIPTFLRMAPYLVGMLVAIGMLRASGAFDLLNHLLAPLLGKLGIPPEIVPIAIVRPFSSAAATGVVADLLHTQGSNTMLSHMATVVAGTSDTTFFIIAIYFGAANIRNPRHAVLTSVMVDIAAILSAVWITRLIL